MDAWEFFDLLKDPGEINNAYNDPAYKDVIEKTKQELMKLRQEVGDTNPINN
ncbi:MAG TPA: DUF4976 domain-containing protein [Candidatus Marinimicrobia bacterium]|nr:DUF4976 domain-containing protein [Candidatus Neomarinimicrobiota bacterium]